MKKTEVKLNKSQKFKLAEERKAGKQIRHHLLLLSALAPQWLKLTPHE